MHELSCPTHGWWKSSFFLFWRVPQKVEIVKKLKNHSNFLFPLSKVSQGTENCPKRLCNLSYSTRFTCDSVQHVVVQFRGEGGEGKGGGGVYPSWTLSTPHWKKKKNLNFTKNRLRKHLKLFKRCNSATYSPRNLCVSMRWATTGWDVQKCTIWDFFEHFSLFPGIY